jgi:hypothetical protein
LSTPAASRGSVCAFCSFPALAIIATALLVFSPVRHRGAVNMASANSFASQPGAVMPAGRDRVQASYAALPMAFEQNQGQTDAQVKYMARGNGYTLFLTANDAVFSLRSRSAGSKSSAVRREPALRTRNLPGQDTAQKDNAQRDSAAVVRMQLVGGNSLAKVEASRQLPGKSNYFLGNHPSEWRRNVARYARVSYQDVYPGVNLAFHGAQRQLEFDFVVAPGADPAPIGFHFTGVQGMKTDDSGNLVISSAAGDVLLHKPVAYQEENGARQAVDARFVLQARNQAGFELGNYDRSRELVIDPSVTYAYSTYLGGSGDDEGYGITFDSSGNAYVTGETASINFPGFSSTNKLVGAANVFVTKVSVDGSSLVYSTYVGGSGTDSGNSIAVNASGDVFVGGGTTSTDFPTTTGAFQPKIGSGAIGNAFVFQLSSDGGTLTYNTYLGGTGDDKALGIALDASGSAYVVGKTSSTDFPTQSPLQTSGGGFVTKLNSSGSALTYSTYLGVSGDSVNAVAVDSSDNAYVTGQTFSSSFHTTSGAFQTTCGSCAGGFSNAFVTVINAAGNGYAYSTFLGGSNNDAADGIAVDSSGDAYVTGYTGSTNFPLKLALQPTYGGGSTDAFVTKLNPGGSALVYSTFLGGNQQDFGASIAIDGGNNAYLTGQTESTNFPPASPTQSAIGGGFDAFVSEINAAGSQLVFSTYLGGSGDEDDGGDYGSIAVDGVGDSIYVTGNTASTDFPTPVPTVFQKSNGGGTDAFVVKYAQPAFAIAATTPVAVAPGTSGTSTVTLTALNGYNSQVTLSCTVTGSGSPLPECSASSFSTNPVTPTAGGAATTLTITTNGASGAMFVPGKVFYAMWLPIAGMSLVGMGFSSSRSRRKRLLGFLMIGMVMTALLLIPACGGSSSGSGGASCAAAPSVPSGLAASATTPTGTTLNWTASTVGANCSVLGYAVYENGVSIGTPTATALPVLGLTPSTTYSFTVAAADSFGASAQSSPVMVTTLPGPTNYTVTITGTDANNRSQSAQVTLAVN